ncbi:activity-dependent neuroprotector homeobox protein 2b [Trematomus bernacchii]|uniref:activity-dependent neuroprotector homeobox protein 2b n=1 Tax=Trematomus bernacchii TaxID=40690 RepID=UPI00146AAC53|nr:activity-dependent neuroprotector homeobox protein 2b [Trematomus bernacchii]
MYQYPVGNIGKIRKARKAVKTILGEIGLEDCQKFLKDLDENTERDSDEEEVYQETDWVDVTDGYNLKPQKKWPYRSQTMCCSVCKYSSRNLYNFRSHISRCHVYLQSFCTLAPCSKCIFIAHPQVVMRHMQYFHSTCMKPQKEAPPAAKHGNERYSCRRCGWPGSSIFTMKKHVILKHLDQLSEQYIGYRLHPNGASQLKVYCCKVCKVNTGNLDQMLHHMLVEPTHYTVSSQVQALIHENKTVSTKATPNGNGMFVTFPNIAPKPQQPQMFKNNSLIIPSNGQPGRTVVTLQQLQAAANNGTLICAPGTNQAFLPPQASALVQLASAEAKGLLQPGATISLRSALPQGSNMVNLPAMSNMAIAPAPLKQTAQTQQIFIQSGLQSNVAAQTGTQPALVTQNTPANQMTLQGTMLTSESLLSHLIPTGNKMNGMPTYTFAPMQVAKPASQSTSTTAKAVEQAKNSTPQTKKWITCPLCNELFPSNVFDMHTEVAHTTKSAPAIKSESVAARAAFLKKMPDKTVKCLTCKILLSEKSVFQHLLHGLNCLYCSALFFSIKQLAEHVKQHNPTGKAYCDFLRQKYRVYSKGVGGILFPYFDVNTTAPREVLGDNEVNLALVTSSLDLIFFKLQPSSLPEICSAPAKINSSYCPFCDEKFQNESDHLQHLKQKHLVAPTIHAILKTEAFKCIYCNGVYTGKVTQQAVMLHIQRCRCSPKQPQPPKPAAAPLQPPKQVQQLSHPVYFLQMPQGMTMTKSIAPARVIQAVAPAPPAPPAAPEHPETEAELQSKKRLETAWREVMETNKREREQRAAMRRKQEQDRLLPPPEPVIKIDPTVKLVLEPTATDRRDGEERKDFIGKYFNVNPYASKTESDELCKRLSISKAELAACFSKRRSKCMKNLKRNTAAIFLGFNMTELRKTKHNLLIPKQQPAETTEQPHAETEKRPPTDSTEQMENSEDGPEPMVESGKEKVTDVDVLPEVEPMEM